MFSIAWIFLIVAGLMEPCWVIGMKKSKGFKDIKWVGFTAFFIFTSMYLLAIAIDGGLPVGTAYAVWTGIGAIGALIAGIVLFKDSIALFRIFFIILMIIGIVGVQVTAGL